MTIIHGESQQPDAAGVSGLGTVADGTRGDTHASAKNGVVGTNDSIDPVPAGQPGGNGVFGFSKNPHASGVFGANDAGTGVAGFSPGGDGTRGDTHASARNGVVGTNDSIDPVPAGQPGGNGVFGFSKNPHASGVFGANDAGTGVAGLSAAGDGTRGDTHASAKNGVVGTNDSTDPVPAGQPGGNGVFGFSKNPHASGVWGANDAGCGVTGSSANAIGVLGRGKIAGRFEGDVQVTGDVQLVNADCAEDFDTILENADPGTVMVLDQNGLTRECLEAYDKRVVGVVSGAGTYKPAIVLDRRQTEHSRTTIALMGKVYCKVDADYGEIEIGDMLTTSRTPGHARKANDRIEAFGAVIGKALRPLKAGRGMIPIFVALQ